MSSTPLFAVAHGTSRSDRARDPVVALERQRAARYPLSRWYLRPAAGQLAAWLTPTRIRPVHLTLANFVASAVAVAILLAQPAWAPVAGLFVLVAWFFDRADGQLARRQGTTSRFGAWLDANVDELNDLALHAALATAAATRFESRFPWLLLVAFFAGKYLLMHGLFTEEAVAAPSEPQHEGNGSKTACSPLLRRLYHLPGNADIRVHLLAAALLTGWWVGELLLIALYYNLRWIARYGLVLRRAEGAA